ncbi:DEAD (Asp-Glu-Ala-Asp) box polypeptide 52, partial [Rhizoclosmatium hyalinum]
MQLFQAKAPSTSTSSASKKKSSAKPETEASLAPELDFFQSAAAPPKTLPEKAARQSDSGDYIEDDSDAEDDDDAPEDDDEESEETLSAAKRRRNDDDDEEDEDDDEDVVLESEKDAKEFRKNHKISVLGSDVPFPFTTYKSLCERYQFPDYLQKNLTSQNYTKPTPIQMQSIPIMLHEREVIACAPTGSGKTLAFLVPILFSLGAPKGDGFRAVIISPTRELALQIHRHIKNLTQGRKFKTCVLTKSNMSSDPNQIAQLAKFDILVTTPMRLVHALDHDQIKLD